MLLPRSEHFTQLLILKWLIHVGTLSQIRQEYCIPQCQAEMRKMISKIMKRHGGSYFQLPNNKPTWPEE